MSVSSIGGSAAQLWELLQNSQANASGSSATTGTSSGTAAPFGPPPASPAIGSSTADPTRSTGSASDAAAKVIADLKSFFLTLQSENGLGDTSTATTGTGDTSGATSSAQQSDIAASATTTTSATDAASSTTTTGHAHHGHHHGGGGADNLQDAVAKLLQQYDAQSSDTSGSTSTTAISA